MLTVDEALTALETCVTVEYDRDEDRGVRVVAQPGETMTADWCMGSCAMAYVRIDGMGVSTQRFPEIDTSPTGVTGPLAVTFHVGIARCVTTLDAQGNPPPQAIQTAEAHLLLADSQRLRHAIRCCLAAQLPKKSTLLGRWTPMGPFGACAGGFWPVTVRAS